MNSNSANLKSHFVIPEGDSNLKSNKPIGVFDSGIGGLTVANAILQRLPNEEIIYFGDTAHLPYGEKSADAIRYYCLQIVKFLLEQDCKLIVIACNTASAAAYRILLEFFDTTLFVNVIDPLVEEVAKLHFSKVGVIATKATTQSGVYAQKLKEAQTGLEVASLATPLLAPMIEEGFFNNQVSKTVIETYLSNPIFNDIEAILLACTHYPLIKKDIADFFEGRVKVFDSTDVVAEKVFQKLSAHHLLNDKCRHPHRFYVSDYTASFEKTTQLFYKEAIQLEEKVIWKDGM